ADPVLTSSSIHTSKVLTTGRYMVIIPDCRCSFIYTNPCAFRTSDKSTPKDGFAGENMSAEV
ncbi:unnamed protein product, partial [marine sediment metagenome]